MERVAVFSSRCAKHGPRLSACLLAAVFLAMACTRDRHDARELDVVYDLVERFELAQARQPTREIDFTSAAVRSFLVRGWRHQKAENADRRLTLQVKPNAELEFFVAEPRETAVLLELVVPGGVTEATVLELAVNTRPWTSVPLVAGRKTYELKLDGDFLKRGENRLGINLGSGTASVKRLDWKSILFDVAAQRHRPEADSNRELLFIPFGTWVDYYLELPAQALLEIGEIRLRGRGRLELVWTPDGQDPRPLPATAERSPVTGAASETGRLSLFALGRDAETSTARGVALVGPRLLRPARPDISPPGTQPASRSDAADPRPHVVIYMIDTLRADHLGCYGYEKNTSPEIDRFAEENFHFLNGQANSSWTRPSVATLLTSLLPQTHGVNSKKDRLSAQALTLAEVLREAGYQTAAVVANGNVADALGFAQGFEYFKYLSKVTPTQLLATSRDVNRVAFQWLDQQGSQRPFFLYLHTIDPHAPYDPPEAERLRFAPEVDTDVVSSVGFIAKLNKNKHLIPDYVDQVKALYDGEIAANDASFGLLLEDLRARGLYDDAIVVVLSDHGEEFFDHGDWVHGKTLHAEMLDTPLIVKMPRGFAEPRRIEQLAQHVDVMPTILDHLGLDTRLPVMQGRSLLPLMRGEAPDWLNRSIAYLDLNARATSIIDGQWKMIQFWDGESEAFPKLYRRSDDVRERRDLGPDRTVLARYLVSIRRSEDEAAMGLDLESAVEADSMAIEEIRENLEALGYLGNQ